MKHYFMIISVVGMLASGGSYALGNDQGLTGDQLGILVAKEMETCLEGQGEFTLLPAGISFLSVFQDNQPAFFMKRPGGMEDLTGDIQPIHKKNFHLFTGTAVLGKSSDGECVVGNGASAHFQIIGKKGVRDVHLPDIIYCSEAYRKDGCWFFKGIQNAYDEGGASVSQPVAGQVNIVRVTKLEEAEIVFSCPQVRKHGQPYQVAIAHDGVVANHESTEGDAAFIRLDTGLFLEIGSRIKLLDETPGEIAETFQQAYEYAVAGNKVAFMACLEKVTQYRGTKLDEFCMKLLALPDPTMGYSELIRSTEVARERFGKKLEMVTKTAANDCPTAIQFSEIGAMYLNEGSKFIADAKRMINDSDLIPLRTIVQNLRMDLQYYEGRWVGGLQIVAQQSLKEVLLSALYIDEETGAQKNGLFFLRADGHLHHVELGEPLSRSASLNLAQVVAENGKPWLIFVPKVGLASITADQLCWINRSKMIAWMNSIEGADDDGRIYFSKWSDDKGYAAKSCWVYNPKGTSVDYLPLDKRFSRAVSCVVDDDGRMWFACRAGTSEYKSERDWTAFKDAANQVDVQWQGCNPQDLKRRSYNMYTLYCYENGEVKRYFDACALNEAVFVPGNNGALFVLGRSKDACSFIVQGDTVVGTRDLHALFQENFEQYCALVPEKVTSVINNQNNSARQKVHQAVCRTGDIVWLNCHGLFEAYKDGKPLFITRRLKLERGTSSEVNVWGINEADVPCLVFSCGCAHFRNLFWARPGDKGISLARYIQPRRVTVRQNDRSYSPGSLFTVLVNAQRREVLVYSGANGLWKLSAHDDCRFVSSEDAPLLITSSGDLVVHHRFSSRSRANGCRVLQKDGLTNIVKSYLYSMKVVAALEDDRLLAIAPGGVAIFGLEGSAYKLEQQYLVDPSVRLSDCLGEVDGEYAFFATDLIQQNFGVVMIKLPEELGRE